LGLEVCCIVKIVYKGEEQFRGGRNSYLLPQQLDDIGESVTLELLMGSSVILGRAEIGSATPLGKTL
jgi:hypothetical protein